MKPTSLSDLKSAKTTAEHLQREVADLEKLGVSTKTRLLDLEATCDLSDAKALAEIGHLHTLAALLPTRQDARERALAEALQRLLESGHTFISSSLGPRLRRLKQAAEVEARARLEALGIQGNTLETAVGESSVVAECDGLLYHATVRNFADDAYGILEYVGRLADAWPRADALEKRLTAFITSAQVEPSAAIAS